MLLTYSIEQAFRRTIGKIVDKIPHPPHKILRRYMIEKTNLERILYPYSFNQNSKYRIEKFIRLNNVSNDPV